MEILNCNLCNSDKTKLLIKIDSWNIVTCKQCGLIYLNPKPTPLEIEELYKKEYFFKEVKQYINIEEAVEEQSEKVRIVRKFKKSGKILDIGCGEGYFLKNAKNHGYEVYGVEFSRWAAERAKENFGIEIFTGDFGKIQLKEKLFDVVTMWHNFEHHHNPVDSLRKIRTILQDNGILIVVLPNVKSFDRKIYGKNWEGWRVPYHFYHFSPNTIKTAMALCGFNTIIIEYKMSSIFAKLRHSENKENKIAGMSCAEVNNKSLAKKIRHHLSLGIRKIFPGRDMTIVANKC